LFRNRGDAELLKSWLWKELEMKYLKNITVKLALCDLLNSGSFFLPSTDE
jgi:hypothetical protein